MNELINNPDAIVPDAIVTDADLYQAFRLMKKKDFDGAAHHISQGLKKAESQNDTNLQGLYYSAYGVLHKLQGDFKKSYKYYQQAEKLLPDESSLKIISAILLIEQFNQFDTAIKKLDKVIQAEAHDAAMLHQAYAAQGMAFLMMGQKSKAQSSLESIIAQNFEELRSGINLDFKLAELFLKKNFQIKLVRSYLEKALSFVKMKNEKVYVMIIQKILDEFSVVGS